MREYTENIKRYCDMDKFAQSICEDMTLTEDEANKFISLLWEQSRADVVEVKHGKWIMECYETRSRLNRIIRNKKFKCSECGTSNGRSASIYCPHCAAKMDKE